jgi:hypothetical protein
MGRFSEASTAAFAHLTPFGQTPFSPFIFGRNPFRPTAPPTRC